MAFTTKSSPNFGPTTEELEIELEGVDPWIGRTLGDRYRVIERIGKGGMGTVYVAEHLTLHSQVALKLVHESEGGDSHAQRFVREAMVTSLIDHPNVISAIDFGTFENGTAYLAMQLVRGPTLGRVLKTEGCLSWARAADVGAQMADALCAAKAHGIVHRDLKPENVILHTLPDGRELVKLLDFGIAKHARDSMAPPPMRSTQAVTRIGVVIGTLGYMAPEQAVGKRADHRSDLYALGALLWECVVGRRLWHADDVQDLLAEQLNKPPRSVRAQSGDESIPDAFDALIAQLLEINPADRPQEPAEVRDALRELVAQVQQGTLISEKPPLIRRAPLLMEDQAATRVARSPREKNNSPTPVRPSPSPPPIVAPPPLVAPPPMAAVPQPLGKLAGEPVPTRVISRRDADITKKRSWPHTLLFLLMPALLVALWLGRQTMVGSPELAAPKPATALTPSSQPVSKEALPEPVRKLLYSLVEGTGREERVTAAETILRYVPVDEVPAWGRAMAHLQLAETCAQKKEQLATIELVDDPRTLPMLIALSQRKRGGCGYKGRDDCLACLRDTLERLISHLETKQMTPK